MAAQENHMDVVQFLLDNGSSQSIATEVSKPARTERSHTRSREPRHRRREEPVGGGRVSSAAGFLRADLVFTCRTSERDARRVCVSTIICWMYVVMRIMRMACVTVTK